MAKLGGTSECVFPSKLVMEMATMARSVRLASISIGEPERGFNYGANLSIRARMIEDRLL